MTPWSLLLGPDRCSSIHDLTLFVYSFFHPSVLLPLLLPLLASLFIFYIPLPLFVCARAQERFFFHSCCGHPFVCASAWFASPLLLSSPHLQVVRRISIVSQESLLLFLIWHPDGPARPLLGVLFFEKASSLPGLSKLFLSLLICLDVCVCLLFG